MRYLINSSDDVTIKNKASVMMCPVTPASNKKNYINELREANLQVIKQA